MWVCGEVSRARKSIQATVVTDQVKTSAGGKPSPWSERKGRRHSGKWLGRENPQGSDWMRETREGERLEWWPGTQPGQLDRAGC